jgi:hypothetical protein
MQVEVSGGRGKPSTIVDKDEGLGKVKELIHLNLLYHLVSLAAP